MRFPDYFDRKKLQAKLLYVEPRGKFYDKMTNSPHLKAFLPS